MSNKKPTYIHGIIGSQLRDTQGEMLSIEGADISELQAGKGRFNDNHGVGYFNSLGRIESAKKIFKVEDCEDDHQRYFWEKVKAPYIYAKGYLYDADDHPNAKAAAAIIRNIYRTDSPLRCRFSVEGGVVARGIADPSLLARTKIHSAAITFTPANNATLVEPLNLDKSAHSWEADLQLIKSVMHLAKTDVPSFRHITRHAQASNISDNFKKINELAKQANLDINFPTFTPEQLIQYALEKKIADNVGKINGMVKALTAGYGGAGAPTSATGGAVIQSESLDDGRTGFRYVTCDECGHEGVHMKHQVRCSKCNKSFSLEKLYKLITK